MDSFQFMLFDMSVKGWEFDHDIRNDSVGSTTICGVGARRNRDLRQDDATMPLLRNCESVQDST